MLRSSVASAAGLNELKFDYARLSRNDATAHRPKSLQFKAGSGINLAMLAKVCSAAVNGIEAYPVEVEVNAGYGDTLDRHRRPAGRGGEGIARPRLHRADQFRLQISDGQDDHQSRARRREKGRAEL